MEKERLRSCEQMAVPKICMRNYKGLGAIRLPVGKVTVDGNKGRDQGSLEKVLQVKQLILIKVLWLLQRDQRMFS